VNRKSETSCKSRQPIGIVFQFFLSKSSPNWSTSWKVGYYRQVEWAVEAVMCVRKMCVLGLRWGNKVICYFRDDKNFFLFRWIRQPSDRGSSSLALPPLRGDRRRKIEEKKENKPLESLIAERERKRNRAGWRNFVFLIFLSSRSAAYHTSVFWLANMKRSLEP